MVHMTSGPFLSISEVSDATGFSVHTLRYYERIGIITPVDRANSGHRRYSLGAVEWLILMSRLRATGMPIADMKRFADLLREGESTIPSRLALLERHRESIESQIAHLEDTRDLVDAKIAAYSTGAATAPPQNDEPQRQAG